MKGVQIAEGRTVAHDGRRPGVIETTGVLTRNTGFVITVTAFVQILIGHPDLVNVFEPTQTAVQQRVHARPARLHVMQMQELVQRNGIIVIAILFGQPQAIGVLQSFLHGFQLGLRRVILGELRALGFRVGQSLGGEGDNGGFSALIGHKERTTRQYKDESTAHELHNSEQ